MADLVFHAELRDGRDVARGFNLTAAQVRERYVVPLRSSDLFVINDKEFDPRHCTLTVIEGRRLGPGQLGIGGLGWSTAVKDGTEVTGRFLGVGPPSAPVDYSEAGPTGGTGPAGPGDRLRERILGRLAAGPLELGDALALSGDLLAGHRVSERLALTETVIWTLLHGGTVLLHASADAAQPLGADDWASVLLEPSAWRLAGPAAPVISATA